MDSLTNIELFDWKTVDWFSLLPADVRQILFSLSAEEENAEYELCMLRRWRIVSKSWLRFSSGLSLSLPFRIADAIKLSSFPIIMLPVLRVVEFLFGESAPPKVLGRLSKCTRLTRLVLPYTEDIIFALLNKNTIFAEMKSFRLTSSLSASIDSTGLVLRKNVTHFLELRRDSFELNGFLSFTGSSSVHYDPLPLKWPDLDALNSLTNLTRLQLQTLNPYVALPSLPLLQELQLDCSKINMMHLARLQVACLTSLVTMGMDAHKICDVSALTQLRLLMCSMI